MKIKNFNEFINEGFSKPISLPKKYYKYHYKNSEILKFIYDKDLKYHEGEFNPESWLRRGDLLPDENKNDEIITDFAGISLSYDLKTGIFNLSMPIKFKREFIDSIFKEFKQKYDVIDEKHSYGSNLIFRIINDNYNLNEGIKPSKIYKKQIIDGYEVLIGKSAQMNDILTFDIANDNDIWLHVSGVPGSHVVIKKQDGDIPKGVIQKAAELAFKNSKATGKAKVVYTERKNVIKNNNHRVGQVNVDYDKSNFIKIN